MIFVSFWATMKDGDLSNSFIGNMEISPKDLGIRNAEYTMEIGGIEDIECLEKHIFDTLIERGVEVTAVSIINWRRFGT